jgi:hypothetical protein
MQDKRMTRAWPDILRTYEEFVSHGLRLQAMINLIAQIQQSHLKSLFGWTSMHDLCIAQTEAEYPYDGPFLRISPRFDGSLEFRYCDRPLTEWQWHRVVPEADAFDRFVRFADELHWFPQRIDAQRDLAS